MARPLWDEALDRHLGIGHIFNGQYGPLIVRSLMGRHVVQYAAPDDVLAHQTADRILTAPTYAVTANMVKVIEHGARELLDNVPTFEFDSMLPSESGFVWLEQPQLFKFYAPDMATGEVLPWEDGPVSGLFWFTVPAVGVHDADFPDKVLNMPGVMLGVVTRKDVAAADPRSLDGLPEYVPFDITAWATGQPWRQVDNDYWEQHHQTEPGIITESGSFWRRWMLSFWSLANEHVEVRGVSRPVKRRAQRALKLAPAPNYGDVRVITLRRRTIVPDDHVPQPTEVAWSHQWVVNGHWRWQPHGKGRALRRWQWIAPYVKGPGDAPLVLRDDVKVLKR